MIKHGHDIVTIDFMNERKRAFQLSIQRTGAVFKDLKTFCRGSDTVARDNPNLTFLLEGRRQVFLRIENHLDLSVEELVELYPTLEDYYG